MKRLVLLAATAAALAAAAGAAAGGWATGSLDATPEGVAPGQPWEVELTILQHGVTPLEGVRPRVIVSGRGGESRQTFAAVPVGEPGVYRASVVFPEAGTWRYAVDDGFSARHAYPPVRIGERASRETRQQAAAAARGGGGDGPDLLLALAAAAVAGLVAGLVTAALRRRREGPAAAGG